MCVMYAISHSVVPAFSRSWTDVNEASQLVISPDGFEPAARFSTEKYHVSTPVPVNVPYGKSNGFA
jgi:hypothetical protein